MTPDEYREEQELLRQRLCALGVFTFESLAAAIEESQSEEHLIEGLIRSRSVNLLVGDSGLGKTPLAIQVGVAVAAGLPLFHRKIGSAGPVLYCDAESDLRTFHQTLKAIAGFMELPSPPRDFHVWSPNWQTAADADGAESAAQQLEKRVRAVRPALVVVDPLRVFWPDVERRNDDAVVAIQSMRSLGKTTGCAWLLIHHRRKVNQVLGVKEIQDDPHSWFQEAAGAHALVNQTDSRIGVVSHPGEADLLLAGFVRGSGPFVPLDLARDLGDDGSPEGYRLLTGSEQLNDADRAVFNSLRDRFRFKDVHTAFARSGSNASRFLQKCCSLQIARKERDEYVKVNGRDGGNGGNGEAA